MAQARKSLLEVQFPIAQLSLESFLERSVTHGKLLNSLGKWWGAKPFVLTRAIILGALFEASDEPARWPEDLEIFLKLMCLDNAGMWKRKNETLPASLCFPHAREKENLLFEKRDSWVQKMTAEQRAARETLEKRVFYTLGFTTQRTYCCRVEETDGPPEESWAEINAYCQTKAHRQQEWVAQMAERRFGRRLRVGDAFSGMGSIPFEAATLGCEVHASDLNPVACLLTWGALNIIAGTKQFHADVLRSQEKLYSEMDAWCLNEGLETSDEGWRAALHLYCVEVTVPEWDGWTIPIAGTWHVAPKLGAWIELLPNDSQKRFDFKVRYGGDGFGDAAKGTKQGLELVCPEPLWKLLHRQGKTENATRSITFNTLISNHGGLRKWEKADIVPRDGDFYGERLYCIRWLKPARRTAKGKKIGRDEFIYREPSESDLAVETKIRQLVQSELSDWQQNGWIPDWRIQDGEKTRELIRTRGWTYWHHLYTPRQLLIAAEYSQRISKLPRELRAATTLNIGLLLNYNSRLCHWHEKAGGGVGSTGRVFYNQALNTFPNYPARSWGSLDENLKADHVNVASGMQGLVELSDARSVTFEADLWITDPPYADAVNYEELSEFFLAWYKPHINACFPGWYTDSKRDHAVKGDDARFRVAMAECYAHLASQMQDDGLQVLMFTHKDTDVWEDLALIMWSAGLQVKQVWSVATETGAGAIKDGNCVQATYNMVLRKRSKNAPMGFVDLVIPQINSRVKEVITHMRDSQMQSGNLSCGYTDTDYLLAAQAVAAEVVTGFSSIDGIDLDEELRTPNKERRQSGASLLRSMMNQAKRTAVDFLVPLGLEEHLRRSPDGTSAYQFWRALAPEEKFLLKALELEAGGVEKIGAFQDLGRAYGIADYEALLGPVKANEARTKLPFEFPRPDMTRWDDVPAAEREQFAHCVTRHLYYALQLLENGAEGERAVKHLVDSTNFWTERQGKHLVILGYLYQTTEPIPAWNDIRPLIQTLRLAVENHRA
jgi:putative DNA methylase